MCEVGSIHNGGTNIKVEGGKIVIVDVEYCYWIDEVLDFGC